MTDTFPITIYHNPKCGTSRNALAMIEAAGYAPTVVEYVKAGWTRPRLDRILTDMGTGPREIMRTKGTPAEELGLTDPGASDEAILGAMVEHPILVNRPIVVSPKGTRLCRPSEAVLDLLERKPDSFTKEDGEVVKLSSLRASPALRSAVRGCSRRWPHYRRRSAQRPCASRCCAGVRQFRGRGRGGGTRCPRRVRHRRPAR